MKQTRLPDTRKLRECIDNKILRECTGIYQKEEITAIFNVKKANRYPNNENEVKKIFKRCCYILKKGCFK